MVGKRQKRRIAYFQNFRLLFVFPFQAEHCILPSCSDLSKIFNGCYRFHTHQLLGLALRRVVASIRACSSSMLIGEVAIGTLGNFSASIGKAKSKKTFNVSAMVAAALSGKEVLNYTTDFPKGKNRILYIDTEQSQNHCMIVMHRIMKLAELPTNEDCDRFYFLALRKFNPKERLAIIDDAISQIEGLGFVVIDGIRDLVYDINSPSEATCVISKLMQWTDEYQIHLHTILHQNKSDENRNGRNPH